METAERELRSWTARLREIREASGLTREQLGRRARVAVATVKACELGYRMPSRPTLITLLKALDADPETRAQLLESAGYSREGAAEIDTRP